MSFVLEKPLMSMIDELTWVVLTWADFRPIPSNYKKFAIMLTSDAHNPKSLPFLKMDLNENDAIPKVFDAG